RLSRSTSPPCGRNAERENKCFGLQAASGMTGAVQCLRTRRSALAIASDHDKWSVERRFVVHLLGSDWNDEFL
ncbi:hypothetical protein HPB47_021736, partial [Ixodes persulcatus]